VVLLLWVGFFAWVLIGIGLDLVAHRGAHSTVRTRQALLWTGFWIVQALCFAFAIHEIYESQISGFGIQPDASTTGMDAVWMYLAGYVTEKSLSLDNVVVIALILGYFRVPSELHHRVLFWGVIGAIVLRLAMIVAGTVLIRELAWITYVFGALLIVSAARMLAIQDDHLEPEKHMMVRAVERLLPVHDAFVGDRILVRRAGRIHLTRLAIVLVLVESSDLVFAVDSIPAIFAITTDPFIVATSNIFAILGLRSLFFAIAPLLDRFHYLRASLVFLLGLIGVKLSLAHHVEIPPVATLASILGVIGVGALASLIASGTSGRRARRGTETATTRGAALEGPPRKR
jgi:tellurite resistance protein TerC